MYKNPDGYFNVHKKPSWFNNREVKRIIKEIDDTEAVQDEFLLSPVYGAIAPERLSTGCKCLILLSINPKCNLYASRMGDNCSDLLLEMAEKTDVIVTFHNLMKFNKNFKAKILDTNEIVETRLELINQFRKVRYNKDWRDLGVDLKRISL